MNKVIRCMMMGVILVACTGSHVPIVIEHQGKQIDVNDANVCLQCHGELQGHSHPVMVPYPQIPKEGYLLVARVREAGIILVNSQVVCVTCHDLTNPAPAHPLSNFGLSQLCLVCHIK